MGLKPPRESAVVTACLALLRARGAFVWRTNGGGMKVGNRYVRFHSINGVSDILGILPGGAGRMIAVECKAGDNYLTPLQALFLQSVREAGGLALVVWDHKELAAALDAAKPGE